MKANRADLDSRTTSGARRRGPRHSHDVRPFLKWAGGKRQLLPKIRQFYPGAFGSYIEPFVGSGAVFFDLYNQGLLDGRRSVLIDNNVDLVGGYLAVRDHTAQVIRNLSRLAAGYKADPQEHYYRVRDATSNTPTTPGRASEPYGSGADIRCLPVLLPIGFDRPEVPTNEPSTSRSSSYAGNARDNTGGNARDNTGA